MFGRKKQTEMHVMTPDRPRFWRELIVGSSVKLRDLRPQDDPLEGGSGALVFDFEITRTRGIAVPDEAGRLFAEYILFDLQGEEINHTLLAVIVEGRLELRVYFTPEELEPATREDLVAGGMTWFFCPPADSEDFSPSELEYARYPSLPPINDEGEERQISFEGTPMGPAYGEYRIPDSNRAVSVALIEYMAMEECANPLILVLEEGGIDNMGNPLSEGGLITVMMGATIDPANIEVYPAAR